MSLKIIPVEPIAEDERATPQKKTQKKGFHPVERMSKHGGADSAGLKSMCLRLIRYVNRGSRFTYEQVDELVTSMYQNILKLQKKKQEILKNKGKKRSQ